MTINLEFKPSCLLTIHMRQKWLIYEYFISFTILKHLKNTYKKQDYFKFKYLLIQLIILKTVQVKQNIFLNYLIFNKIVWGKPIMCFEKKGPWISSVSSLVRQTAFKGMFALLYELYRWISFLLVHISYLLRGEDNCLQLLTVFRLSVIDTHCQLSSDL